MALGGDGVLVSIFCRGRVKTLFNQGGGGESDPDHPSPCLEPLLGF